MKTLSEVAPGLLVFDLWYLLCARKIYFEKVVIFLGIFHMPYILSYVLFTKLLLFSGLPVTRWSIINFVQNFVPTLGFANNEYFITIQ